MKTHRTFRPVLAAVLVTLVVGCGDDEGPTGSGGAAGAAGSNAAGHAGVNAQGGTSSAGTTNVTGGAGGAGSGSGGAGSGSGGGGVGGKAGSAGSGNTAGGKGSCGPTEVGYKTSSSCMGSDLPVFPVGYTLDMPMTAGQTYAIGYGVNGSSNPKVEIWGTSAECGAKVELLSSETRAEGRYCVELHPTAAHTSVYATVSESASGVALLSFCPNGTCQ
jgi:hypothetical protein